MDIDRENQGIIVEIDQNGFKASLEKRFSDLMFIAVI